MRTRLHLAKGAGLHLCLLPQTHYDKGSSTDVARLYMDSAAGRIDVLDASRSWRDGAFSPVPLAAADLMARPERQERVAWLQRRRQEIPATIRLLLDATTTCMEGVTPVGLDATQPL